MDAEVIENLLGSRSEGPCRLHSGEWACMAAAVAWRVEIQELGSPLWVARLLCGLHVPLCALGSAHFPLSALGSAPFLFGSQASEPTYEFQAPQ